MKVRSLERRTLTLRAKNLTMNQPLDMNLFVITNFDLSSENGRVSMKIVLKRKIMSEMMTTYFPSALLMLITFATTFFKPFFFEAALSVNLTTMLVMTTIFISKMEGLPPTSTTKMIDYWLILCQLVPFAEVVLITAMEYQREDNNENEENGDQGDKEANKDNTQKTPCDGDESVPTVCEAWKATQKKRWLSLNLLKTIGKRLSFLPIIEFEPFDELRY